MSEPPEEFESLPDSMLERRAFLKALGVASVVAASASAQSAPSDQPHASSEAAAEDSAVATSTGYIFFNSVEVRCIEAAVDTLIPGDAVGPGRLESGVATYIDRQMAGGFGAGAQLYLQGPFAEGSPQQSWQLPMTPAQAMRSGIADVDAVAVARKHAVFADLSLDDRIAVLKDIEAGKTEGTAVPPQVFFNLLLSLVQEGYFGDPIYGGNRGKAAWRMLGFPGVVSMYADAIVTYRNKPYPVHPHSIQDFS